MPDTAVIVGYAGKPHGLSGELAVRVITDEPERRFAPGAAVALEDGTDLTLAASRTHNGVLLVRFAEIGSRDAAESLRGQALWAELYDLSDENTFHGAQLAGLAVRGADGAQLGVVARVLHLPAQDLLEVQTADGPKLVPFVKDLVPEVDVAGGFLVVADIPGLLKDG
ncbi:MAG: ribosome maturation factor RimM [Propionibacteriaceae bacterium]|jgi:16S rRNA processing protein RimM|nr:ribosome maturation factor RimM [Propionibacteriaceae bacterium]